ncbi:MAG: hypothetical protein IJK18_03565 [Clostridia bacterium]|nr:hypothetical protein [Clostridia bacterium]
MYSKGFIDLKKAMAVENLEQRNKIKSSYFEYLDLENVTAKKKDEKFLEHYNQEILGLGLKTEILQLMEQWKKEYNIIIKRNAIDSDLVKKIKQRIYEFYNNGLDKNTILQLLKGEFGNRIPKNVSMHNLLSDIMNSYLDSITR